MRLQNWILNNTRGKMGNIMQNKIINETNWENLGISNDFIFGKVIQNPKLCVELLRRILPHLKIKHIEYPELQKSIKQDMDTRSVRLDDISKELKVFLDYVAGKKTEDSFIKKLENAVKDAKQNRE